MRKLDGQKSEQLYSDSTISTMKLSLVLVIGFGNVIAEGYLLEYLAAAIKYKFFTPPPDKINSEFFDFGECNNI